MINGLSNFLFFNDAKPDSKSGKIMNLLFLNSEMRLRATSIVQASVLNIEVLFGRCFLNISPLCIVAHPVIFSSLDPSVKMCKHLGYLSLNFSNSSQKISGEFYFCGIYRAFTVYVWGLYGPRKNIWYNCLMYFYQIHVYFSNDCFHLEVKGFYDFSFFWNSFLYFG